MLALLLLLDAAALAALAGWPAHLPVQLLLYVGAGLVWLAAAFRPRDRPRWLLIPALVLHVVALAWPPRHSDDYHRYLWDGAVQRAGMSPYAHAPEDDALREVRNDDFAAMNNRTLPTIYPPGAQLAFRLAAAMPAPPLVGWKLVVAACDLLTALLFFRRKPALALLWLSCPLVILELCVNAHVEAVGLLPFVAALVYLDKRPELAGFCLGLASAVKVLPIYLLVLVRRRTVLLFGALALAIVCTPYLSPKMAGSLGEYGRRWRSNDGAFAGVLEIARFAQRVFHLREPTDHVELGRLGPLITGRDRLDVYPDELAGAIARLVVLVVFVAVLVAIRHKRPVEMARMGIGAFLLLTPSLHPWYALWLLPPLLLDVDGAPRERLAWLWLVALVPLGHVPLIHYLSGGALSGHGLPGRPLSGIWKDPAWTRVIEHVPALALLVQLPPSRGVVYSRTRCTAHSVDGQG